jgi:hypothetical protein
LINRPVCSPSREFILAQADKCKKFIDVFKEVSAELPSRVKDIVTKFRNEGVLNQAIQAYDNLNGAIYDAIIKAKAIRKKFGYKRFPELCRAGLTVNFWKSIQSSIFRQQPPPLATANIAEELGIDIDKAMSMSKSASVKKTPSAVQDLRAVQ